MSIKFQYNKTSLQNLIKQQNIRIKALPTIKNKEAALRVEVINTRHFINELENKLRSKKSEYNEILRLWAEFDSDLIKIEDVKLNIRKIAGVRTPVLEEIIFHIEEFSLFNSPLWFLDGISIIKELTQMSLEKEFYERKMSLLDHARKKTTQKVNLYEKVQIPGYDDAIKKIKRFIEDEENLSKSAQKIIKNRKQNIDTVQ